MTLALMGWSNVWAAAGDEVYGYETEGGSGPYFNGVELSDGTAAIHYIQNIGDATTIDIPTSIYDTNAKRTINISQVGNGSNTLNLYSDWAWTDCSAQITTLNIADGITTIAASAFCNRKLTVITFGKDVATIGAYAFQNCNALTSVTFYGSTAPTIGDNAFATSDSPWYNTSCIVKVPDGTTAAYRAKSWHLEQIASVHHIHELSYPSITTAGWGTYYNTYGYTMPAGVEGYIITSTAGTTANLVKVYDPGDEVVADIALLWKSTTELDEETWYTVEALSSGGNTATWPKIGETAYTNLLCGSQAGGTTTAWGTESSDYYYYKLAYNNSGENLGWYWASEEGAAFTSGAHKAWLIVANSLARRSYISLFGDITSIENVEAVAEGKAQEGKFIENGKMVIVKNGKKFNANGARIY